LQSCKNTVVIIIGVLAAVAIPACIGQQERAKDTAAQAQLRTAATAQQLHYAEEDAYAGDAEALEVPRFQAGRPGGNRGASSGADGYCMEAPGGATERFRITQDIGKPERGGCPVGG
jgi:type II secretory pathway pseudopilin PulG